MARYKYQGTFKDGNGRVVGTATTSDGVAGTISVYLAGTTTAASVYTASTGGVAVNSVTTDTHGYFYFWVDHDDYTCSQQFKIVLSHSDFESKTYDNLVIMHPSFYYFWQIFRISSIITNKHNCFCLFIYSIFNIM